MAESAGLAIRKFARFFLVRVRGSDSASSPPQQPPSSSFFAVVPRECSQWAAEQSLREVAPQQLVIGAPAWLSQKRLLTYIAAPGA